MKELAQGFNTAPQDSNPGSRSPESEALPLSHCAPVIIYICCHGHTWIVHDFPFEIYHQESYRTEQSKTVKSISQVSILTLQTLGIFVSFCNYLNPKSSQYILNPSYEVS